MFEWIIGIVIVAGIIAYVLNKKSKNKSGGSPGGRPRDDIRLH